MPTIKIADKPTLDTVSSNVTTVKNAVQNSTYGLQAIKTAIGNISGGLVPTFIMSFMHQGTGSDYTYTATQNYKYYTALIYYDSNFNFDNDGYFYIKNIDGQSLYYNNGASTAPFVKAMQGSSGASENTVFEINFKSSFTFYQQYDNYGPSIVYSIYGWK